ncbi:MAG: maleylpyruvate isomerase family mycothiol-dependent enzyme, partial [Kibdelosporangium sp.]
AIEAGSGRRADDLRADVRRSSAELAKAWAELSPGDWARPVRYREATVAITVPTRWREVETHTADLDLGYRTADWAPGFCGQLIEFLAPRVPAGTKLTLTGPHGQWSFGQGEPVEVSGDITDLAAWLAGRAHGVLTTTSAALPELQAWP